MKNSVKTGIVFVLTLVIIIALFWFVLPLTPVPGYFGGAYFAVAIIGSILLSMGISTALGKLLFGRK